MFTASTYLTSIAEKGMLPEGGGALKLLVHQHSSFILALITTAYYFNFETQLPTNVLTFEILMA
jgi:hypothetical protein